MKLCEFIFLTDIKDPSTFTGYHGHIILQDSNDADGLFWTVDEFGCPYSCLFRWVRGASIGVCRRQPPFSTKEENIAEHDFEYEVTESFSEITKEDLDLDLQNWWTFEDQFPEYNYATV